MGYKITLTVFEVVIYLSLSGLRSLLIPAIYLVNKIFIFDKYQLKNLLFILFFSFYLSIYELLTK